MKNMWWLLTLLWMPSANASTEIPEKTKLTFSVNAPGSSPFLYFDQASNAYQGVVVDFFASFEHQQAFNIEYLDTSRARYENTLINSKADVFVSAKAWLKNTQRFIFSRTLATHNSYLYATQKFSTNFMPTHFKQARICTRYTFTYPSLGPYFQNGDLIRLNSSNNSTMTDMLIKGRCNFLIMGSEDARALMFAPKYCKHEFYESPKVMSSVDMVFVFRPELELIRAKINRQLGSFIESGERDQSIKRHVGEQLFPKKKCP